MSEEDNAVVGEGIACTGATVLMVVSLCCKSFITIDLSSEKRLGWHGFDGEGNTKSERDLSSTGGITAHGINGVVSGESSSIGEGLRSNLVCVYSSLSTWTALLSAVLDWGLGTEST